MESLGEKLKTARETKGISFDQAGKDTKIAYRYLEALENENFSCFPGETYITGFLRNYGNYLELDVQGLLSLYRAYKIQEQPVPVEQLLKRPSPLPKIAIGALLALLILGAAGGGVYLFMNRPDSPESTAPASRNPVEYVMSGASFEHRFYRGDTLIIPVGEDQLRLELMNLGEVVTIGAPGGPVIIGLSQDANVDLDYTGISSVRISAIDYARNNPDMGVLLRFEINNASFFGQEVMSAGALSMAGQTASTVIFSTINPHPFTLQSQFQAYCMFRWEVLFERDRRERREQFFQRADELNIQAQNGIRIWVSNAQAANFRVIGAGRTIPFELGSPGEVVVADIRWVRDDDNRFRLIVARLET